MDDFIKKLNDRMGKMLEDNKQALEDIDSSIEKIKQDIEKFSQDRKACSEKSDLKGYEEATGKIEKAKVADEMYAARRSQINSKAFVSEAESDKTVDSVFEYENKLAADYEQRMGEIIKAMLPIQAEYESKVKDAEEALSKWENHIHENTRFVSNSFTSPLRLESRVSIRWAGPYFGGDFHRVIENFLNETEVKEALSRD